MSITAGSHFDNSILRRLRAVDSDAFFSIGDGFQVARSSGNLVVDGTLTVNSTTALNDDTEIDGSLIISGNTTISEGYNLTVGNDLTVVDDIFVGDNIYLESSGDIRGESGELQIEDLYIRDHEDDIQRLWINGSTGDFELSGSEFSMHFNDDIDIYSNTRIYLETQEDESSITINADGAESEISITTTGLGSTIQLQTSGEDASITLATYNISSDITLITDESNINIASNEGSLIMGANKVIVNLQNGNTSIDGTLSISGDTALAGTLDVSDDTTITGEFAITGNFGISGAADVSVNSSGVNIGNGLVTINPNTNTTTISGTTQIGSSYPLVISDVQVLDNGGTGTIQGYLPITHSGIEYYIPLYSEPLVE